MPLIKLPRKRLISMDRDNIVVDVPEKDLKLKKKIDMDVIKRAKGIWKKKVDGVKYQKNIRSEWD